MITRFISATRRKSLPQPSHLPPSIERQEAPERSYTEFDDASPTGGQGISTEKPQAQGSAWDRLRSGVKPSSQKKTSAWEQRRRQGDKQDGQSAWDGYRNNNQQESMEGSADTFSFSKSEEERSFAKAQAQKEFDAQVDRERNGGEFNSNTRQP